MTGIKNALPLTLAAVWAERPDSVLAGRVAGPRDLCPAARLTDLVEVVANKTHHRCAPLVGREAQVDGGTLAHVLVRVALA